MCQINRRYLSLQNCGQLKPEVLFEAVEPRQEEETKLWKTYIVSQVWEGTGQEYTNIQWGCSNALYTTLFVHAMLKL